MAGDRAEDIRDGALRDYSIDDSGTYLKTSSSDDPILLAEGSMAGKSFIHKFGLAPDFDTGDNEVTAWDGANDAGIDAMNYTYSTTADIDSIVSTGTADILPVDVQGLDTNYDSCVQTVNANGTVRVALGTSLIRVFRLKNVGTADAHGVISCYGSSAITDGVVDDPTKVRAQMAIGNNQTLMALYTVPNGCTGFMDNFWASTARASKSTSYTVKVKARPFGQVFQLKHQNSISDIATGYVQHSYRVPEKFTEKTDIEMTVQADEAGVTGATISAGFDLTNKAN